MGIFSSTKTTVKSLRARFSVSISFWAMRWAPQGLHSRVADPVPTPQYLHGTGDFRPKRNCWRWVPQYSYTQLLPQISREFTFSQAQILVALILSYDKSILPSKWKIECSIMPIPICVLVCSSTGVPVGTHAGTLPISACVLIFTSWLCVSRPGQVNCSLLPGWFDLAQCTRLSVGCPS